MAFSKLIRRHWGKVSVLLLLPIAFLWIINLWMTRCFDQDLFENTARIPENRVGLVLGTGPLTGTGKTNLHFTVRMDAAARLYYSGKVQHLLLSGCNEPCEFDEPLEMKRALMKKGIPESAMTLDRGGDRTFDSMARARRVFGAEKVTIVTQKFHGPRAAFLAKAGGLDAVVFCAEKLPSEWEFRVGIREVVARVRAVLDVHVLRRGELRTQAGARVNN